VSRCRHFAFLRRHSPRKRGIQYAAASPCPAETPRAGAAFDWAIDTPSQTPGGLPQLKSGRTSAPRLPQAVQVKRCSMSDSRTSSGRRSALRATLWLGSPRNRLGRRARQSRACRRRWSFEAACRASKRCRHERANYRLLGVERAVSYCREFGRLAGSCWRALWHKVCWF
jgi:hypothetical protein